MPKGAITEYVDVAQLVLYAFWIFFLGLIFYLRREDKREGYPLVYDRPENRPYLNFPPIPAPKTYLLPDGKTVQAPRPEHASYDIKAAPTAGWTGAPFVPIGNPMLDAIGPGAYAMREDVPDLTYEGLPKIVPLSVASGEVVVKTEAVAPKGAGKVDVVKVASTIHLSPRDPDPRGMRVIGADGVAAGTVTDVWVDRSEVIIRYLQVDVDGVASTGPILLPMNFSKIDGKRREVRVEAILASQFANVPVLKAPDEVTLREEDRVCAYYGGGTLYATPARGESFL
jgi:photosynthetic reaction center H subunit